MPESSATTSSLSKRKEEKINPGADHEEVVQFLGDIEGERRPRHYIWYFLDVKHGKIIKSVKLPEHVPFTSTPVSDLNHIYLLGGNEKIPYYKRSFPAEKDFFPTSVVRFDLDNIEKGWTDAPSMLFGRSIFVVGVVAFEGKVYIFGGNPTHFAEVFYIVEDSWAELKPPFDSFRASYHVLLDSSRSRILVHCELNNSLYAYNVADETWDCLDENYGARWSLSSVIVDGVIYSLDDDDDDEYYYTLSDKGCSLRAYDVDEKKELGINCFLSGNEARVIKHKACLYHLGNHKLCLAGYDSDEQCIQYVRFSVCKWEDSGAVCVIRDPAIELLQSIESKGFSKFVWP